MRRAPLLHSPRSSRAILCCRVVTVPRRLIPSFEECIFKALGHPTRRPTFLPVVRARS